MYRHALIPLVVLLSLVGAGSVAADPLLPPSLPQVTGLRAATAAAAQLSWEAMPGRAYRLCVAHDRQRRHPYACFPAGRSGETAVGVPERDGELFLLALQACWVREWEWDCSDAVDAGVVGRRTAGDFDFYGTALLRADGQVQLGGYSLRDGATISYHQARPGRADQRRSTCAAPDAAPCESRTLTVRGALAGVSQEVPGAGSAGLTFELRDRPRAALLFDDGTGLLTGERFTAQVILDHFGVKGTFFLIGSAMRAYPAAVRALVAAGHRVGNHTWSHPFLIRLSDAQIVQELDLTERQYRALVPGGTTKPCFRAPNGSIDRRVRTIVEARGYRQIDWDVGSLDYSRISAEQIVRNVLRDLHDGALISFHTNQPATMTALSTLLPLMQSWGYVFDLVC